MILSKCIDDFQQYDFGTWLSNKIFEKILLTRLFGSFGARYFGQDFFYKIFLWDEIFWMLSKLGHFVRIQAASLIPLHFYWCPTTKFYNWQQKSHKINALCSKLQWTDQYCSTLGIIQTLDSQPTNNPAHWGVFVLISIGAQQLMSKSTKIHFCPWVEFFKSTDSQYVFTKILGIG